jgi:hypothetical protein
MDLHVGGPSASIRPCLLEGFCSGVLRDPLIDNRKELAEPLGNVRRHDGGRIRRHLLKQQARRPCFVERYPQRLERQLDPLGHTGNLGVELPSRDADVQKLIKEAESVAKVQGATFWHNRLCATCFQKAGIEPIG